MGEWPPTWKWQSHRHQKRLSNLTIDVGPRGFLNAGCINREMASDLKKCADFCQMLCRGGGGDDDDDDGEDHNLKNTVDCIRSVVRTFNSGVL